MGEKLDELLLKNKHNPKMKKILKNIAKLPEDAQKPMLDMIEALIVDEAK